MPLAPAVQTVLDEYDKRSAQESRRRDSIGWDRFVQERDEYLLGVGPATGLFMNLLVREANARTILEVGTSYGYSTVWLAEAARATGGKVITLDLHAYKQQHAREQLTRAGLEDLVDFRTGDARELLAGLETSVDFALLDLWKNFYIASFDLLYPKLNPGAIVVADNMLYPETAHPFATAYRKHVRATADIQSVLLPIGQGIEVSRYVRGLEAVAV